MFCTKSKQFFVHFDGKLFTVHFAQIRLTVFVQNHDATSPPLRPPQQTSMPPHLSQSFPYYLIRPPYLYQTLYTLYVLLYTHVYTLYVIRTCPDAYTYFGQKKRSVDLKGRTLLRICHRIIHTHTPLLPHNRKACSP